MTAKTPSPGTSLAGENTPESSTLLFDDAPPAVEIDLSRQHRKLVITTLFKTLAIPLAILAFLLIAPLWWNIQVRDSVIAEVNAIPELTAQDKAARIEAVRQMDFQVLSKVYPPYLENLHKGLVNSGVAARFDHLRWARWTVTTHVTALIVGLAILALLARNARKSIPTLIWSYHLAWRIVLAMALLNIILLVPLLAYAFFEATTMATNRIFVGVLVTVLAGGSMAIWHTVKILLTNIPLEFGEAMARHITPEDAPALWNSIRTAATSMGTEPPDNIVIGMQMNFYVTELAVHHSSGKTEGKTLFLSYPLLKQFPLDEVMAIVGHELGHFIGADTALSRDFYPLRQKFNAIFLTLAHLGWAARPAAHLLHLFAMGFEQVFGDYSRKREFQADQKGADLTTPATQAHALVRLHVVLETLNRALIQPALTADENPFDICCSSFISHHITSQDIFWSDLFKKSQSHPLDSHPPLNARLASLGIQVTPEQARAITAEAVSPTFNTWFPNRGSLFEDLLSEAKQALMQIQSQSEIQTADASTPEGRELLHQTFPLKTWPGNMKAYKHVQAVTAFFVILPLLGIVLIPDHAAVTIMVGFTMIFLTIYIRNRGQHKNALLTLDSTGLHHTSWKRPLAFSEISQITTRQKDRSYILHLRLQPGVTSPAKIRLLPFRLPSLAIKLAFIEGNSLEIAQDVINYYARKMAAATRDEVKITT